MRAKLVAIVAILWVAAVGAISVAFYANRTELPSSQLSACLYDTNRTLQECAKLPHQREFEWGGWLAWTGTITLVAVVVLAIILIVLPTTTKKEPTP